MFAEHRRALMDRMEDAAAVFFAAPEVLRNNDTHYDHRQDSDFFYLTGFGEPEAVLVLAPANPVGDQVILFLRTHNPEREIWDGERLGVERAVEVLGVDKAFPIEDLADTLPEYFKGVSRLHFALGRHRADDEVIQAAMASARRFRRTGLRTAEDLLSLAPLHELRLIKDDSELALLRQAARINAAGHRRAMTVARPGLHEYQIQAAMEFEWKVRGARHDAFSTIVASGPHACTLHYVANDRRLEAGDLLLVDAGCEYQSYASDVTRTYPVSGHFTEPQRAIYQLVLDAQLAAIAECRVGKTFDDVHQAAVKVLVEGLCRLGLLEGPAEARIADEKYKRFYMHRTSHWMGLDVHDVGRYHVDGQSRQLEPGMVLTVEPGLYLSPKDAELPEAYRGIGVRIEDDVVITDGDPEVLTAAIPKEVETLEALIGTVTLAVDAPTP